MDLYKILEIEKNATKEDIKKAYRKLAMKYHPDRNSGDKQAESKFKEINEAYSTLSDDIKRRQYDTFGSVSGASGFSNSNGFNVDVDLSDIFESFFGGGTKASGKTKKRKGEDLEFSLKIDLKTSIYGGNEKLVFNKLEICKVCNSEGGSGKKTCEKCDGSGRITYTQRTIFGVIQQTGTCDECEGSGEKFEKICEHCNGSKRIKVEKIINLDIPAGIDNQMIIKLSGQGNDGIGTTISGDLYVKFVVDLEEKGLKRKGNSLYYNLEIDVIEAILGNIKEIKLPILGKRKIEIKPGTPHGSILKISGDGVKNIDNDKKGDLFITLDIKIPQKLSKKEKDLYEQISKERKLELNIKKGIFDSLF